MDKEKKTDSITVSMERKYKQHVLVSAEINDISNSEYVESLIAEDFKKSEREYHLRRKVHSSIEIE